MICLESDTSPDTTMRKIMQKTWRISAGGECRSDRVRLHPVNQFCGNAPEAYMTGEDCPCVTVDAARCEKESWCL